MSAYGYPKRGGSAYGTLMEEASGEYPLDTNDVVDFAGLFTFSVREEERDCELWKYRGYESEMTKDGHGWLITDYFTTTPNPETKN